MARQRVHLSDRGAPIHSEQEMPVGTTLKIAEASERLLGSKTTLRRLNRNCFMPARPACEGACRYINVAPAPDTVRTSMVELAGAIRQGNPF